MSSAKKMLLSAAGNAGGPTDVSDVFSTFLYEGNGSTQTITNNIDLDGEGGLVWTKNRTKSTTADVFYITDTERGVGKVLTTSTNGAQAADADTITGFTSAGFALGDDDVVNTNNEDFVSWTFRKSPKFFDMVTYEGNSETAFTVNHNLGVTPGMIILKAVDQAGHWYVWHRGLSSTSHRIILNSTAEQNADDNYEIGLNASATEIYIDTGSDINSSGTYIAYLFAHHDGDGEFGPDGDQDIIYHGSYEGNGNTTGPVIDLGWEPQWLLIKEVDATSPWSVLDTQRGIAFNGRDQALRPNSAQDAEYSSNHESVINLSATGFSLNGTGGDYNTNNSTYLYTAIRAPMITPPAAATEVFKGYSMTGLSLNDKVDIDFPPDMILHMHALGGKNVLTRLTGAFLNPGPAAASNRNWLLTSYPDAMDTGGYSIYYDNNNTSLKISNNYGGASNADITSFQWKRAPSFFDVVTYKGTGSAKTEAHSLGVTPEMVWVKNIGVGDPWAVYYGDNTDYLVLNTDAATVDNANWWNDTSPTSSVFTVGTDHSVNASGEFYTAYLFATLAGVSKVGSVSHSGSSTDVSCGFSNGARFVMLKRTDAAGHWYIFDTISGIVSGNDPYYVLDSQATISGINYAHQITNSDFIDPLASGFQISGDFTDGTYLFYAIA